MSSPATAPCATPRPHRRALWEMTAPSVREHSERVRMKPPALDDRPQTQPYGAGIKLEHLADIGKAERPLAPVVQEPLTGLTEILGAPAAEAGQGVFEHSCH